MIRYVAEGTAADGQTWRTEGDIDASFPDCFDRAMVHSFQQLTQGKAAFGKQGVGCRGPYKVKRFELTEKPLAAGITRDDTHIGILEIDPMLLGHIFRLPDGAEVIGARVGFGERIELLIAGPNMPDSRLQGTPTVMLRFHTEFRDALHTDDCTRRNLSRPSACDPACKLERQVRVMGSWEHLPDHHWLIRNWEPA